MTTYRLTVTRALVSGSPAALELPQYDGATPVFTLDPQFKPGHQETQPIWATSPFTAPIQTGEVAQPATQGISIHAHADGPQVLQDRMQELVDAFRQLTYTITYEHISDDGLITATYQWQCGPASIGPGDGETFADDELAALTQAVMFTVPRAFIPTEGPF